MCEGEWMGVSGGQGVSLVWPRAIVRYGHIDANALWPRPSCRGCRQKPANVSSSNTHKSQEPCLMAHQHRQKASGHLDGCDLVLCKLAFWGLFTQLVHCEIMWSYELKLENHLNLTISPSDHKSKYIMITIKPNKTITNIIRHSDQTIQHCYKMSTNKCSHSVVVKRFKTEHMFL